MTSPQDPNPLPKLSPAEVLEKIEATRATLESLPERLDEVADRGDTTRNIVYGVILALILAGGFYLYDTGQDNRARNDADERYRVEQCEAGNVSRAKEKKLWDDLIAADVALTEAEGIEVSDAERKAIEDVITNVNEAYPTRDCDEAERGEVVNVSPSPGTPKADPVAVKPTPKPKRTPKS